MSVTDLTQRSAFRIWCEEKIRFNDLDRHDHVNNLAICAYIENARVELRERLFSNLAHDAAIAWLVVNFEVAFRAPVHYPGRVDVGSCSLRVGTSSYLLGHGVFSGETCVATAKTTTVFGSRETAKSQPMPEELRSALASLAVAT